MDSQIGRLVQAIKDLGVYDDTLIVVVADHGEGLGDHDWWSHRLIYQEQIRVPLIMRIPGGPRGKVVDKLVRTIDIYPTVLEWLGVEPPGAVDGRSLQALVEDSPDSPRVAYADALIEFDLNAGRILKMRPNDDLLYCMMDSSWKLIYRPRQPERSELYRLDHDPHELNNVFSKYPNQAERLLVQLDDLDPFVEEPFGEGQDADTLERLRALGYLGDEEQ